MKMQIIPVPSPPFAMMMLTDGRQFPVIPCSQFSCVID
jgi:hypothetical protein